MKAMTSLSKSLERREDRSTRTQILETAGNIFALKGFDRTTGKEITEQAQCNSAAINYHFGGVEGLYGEVLVEAHHRLLNYEELRNLECLSLEPTEKLKIFTKLLMKAILSSEKSSWPLRVFGREILSPSKVFSVLMERELIPKQQLVSKFIAEYLDIPVDHAITGIATLSFIAPYIMLLIGNRQMLTKIIPVLFDESQNPESLLCHLQTFSFGGLEALKRSLDLTQIK